MSKLMVGLVLGLLLLSSFVSAASFDLRDSTSDEVVLEVDGVVDDYVFGLWIGKDYFSVSLLDDGLKIGFSEYQEVDHVVSMSIKDFGVFVVDLLVSGDMDRVGLLSTTFGVDASYWIEMSGLGVEN